MHAAAYGFVQKMAGVLAPRRRVLEIGARDVNGSVRPVFAGAEYLGIDVRSGKGVDVVADGATWRSPTLFDTVVCTEVLEHTPAARQICLAAFHQLEAGGVFILTAAGEGRAPHGVDGGPVGHGEFYENVPEFLLREWLAPFGLILTDRDGLLCDVRGFAVKA